MFGKHFSILPGSIGRRPVVDHHFESVLVIVAFLGISALAKRSHAQVADSRTLIGATIAEDDAAIRSVMAA
jgi:hypothetical protein